MLNPRYFEFHPGLSHRKVEILDWFATGMPIEEARALATSARHRRDRIEVDPAKDRAREPHTQAAISAREHRYAVDGFAGRLLNPDSAWNVASIAETAKSVGHLFAYDRCILAQEQQPLLWLVQALSNR
jgi:hypothetical protein